MANRRRHHKCEYLSFNLSIYPFLSSHSLLKIKQWNMSQNDPKKTICYQFLHRNIQNLLKSPLKMLHLATLHAISGYNLLTTGKWEIRAFTGYDLLLVTFRLCSQVRYETSFNHFCYFLVTLISRRKSCSNPGKFSWQLWNFK